MKNGSIASAAARLTSLLVFAVVPFVPGVTEGGEPRTHDGLFLRLSGGAGHASTAVEEGDSRTEFSGGSGDINLAIGGVVSTNFAIHGTVLGWIVSDPEFENDFLAVTEPGDLTMIAYGAGVTYYFMPVNIYLSPSVGLASIDELNSDLGIAIDLTAGKEWWVGGSWGLGVALAFGYHSVPDGNNVQDVNWGGPSFGVRFSATLN